MVDMLKPKYWIGTHEPIKEGVGIVQTFLRRTVVDVEEVKKERKDSGVGAREGQDGCVEFREIENGGRIEMI